MSFGPRLCQVSDNADLSSGKWYSQKGNARRGKGTLGHGGYAVPPTRGTVPESVGKRRMHVEW